MSKGGISADEVAQSFKDATQKGGMFYKGMEEGSKTFEGQVSTMKDNFNEFAGAVTKPIFNYLTNTALPAVNKLLGFLNEHSQEVITTLSGFATATGVMVAVSKLRKMDTVVGLLTGKIKLATVATNLWGKAMKFLSANKFIILAGAIAGIAAALGVASSQAGGFDKLFAIMGEKIGGFVTKIAEAMPQIIAKFQELLPKIIEVITTNAPILLESGVQIISTLIDGIITMLPMLLEMGANLLVKLINGITNNIPKIINTALKIITSLTNGIINNLPKIITVALKLVIALAKGIISNLPRIIKVALRLVVALAGALIKNLPKIIAAGGKLLLAVVRGILKLIGKIITTGVDIVKKLWHGISSKVSWFLGKVVSFAKSIPEKIKSGIGKVLDIGKNIVSGIWNGISGKVQWLKDKISGAFKGVKEHFKKIFDIHSPSKWAKKILGFNLMYGFGNGISEKIGYVSKKMKDAYSVLSDDAQLLNAPIPSVPIPSGVVGNTTSTRNLSYDNRTVVQNFYNKKTSPFEAYRKVGTAFEN